MNEQEKQDAGITPDMEAKGTFGASNPQHSPPSPPPPTEPPKDAPPEPPKPAEEPAAAPETPKDATAKSKTKDIKSRMKAKIGKVKSRLEMVNARLAEAKGDERMEAFYKDRAEEEQAEHRRIMEEMEADYVARMAEAIPDAEEREQLSQYCAKYTPLISKSAPDFADWWAEQPRHFESMYGVYLGFARGNPTPETFIGWTDYDKKKFVSNLLKLYDVEMAKKNAPPAGEPPKPPEPPKPLPKVDGEIARAGDQDDMQAIHDKQRARAIARR